MNQLAYRPQIPLLACPPMMHESCSPMMHRRMQPPKVPAQLANHRNAFHTWSQGSASSTASSATAVYVPGVGVGTRFSCPP